MLAFFASKPQALQAHCRDLDLPRYLADQLLDWVYRKGVSDPAAMTNVSERNRARLAQTIRFCCGRIDAHQVATDGTEKLLLGWTPIDSGQGEPTPASVRQTECVMIPTERRRTACISSQVGCPVGCRFCASGLNGLQGNLRTHEIVEQVYRLSWMPGAERITNVVFMGMGEPLANFAAVTDAIRILNAPWALNIGARRITVSTVGLPEAIRKLIDFEIPVTLALSLHAPNDDVRRELIPWARFATIADLLDACQAYFKATGREITLEYLLIRGVNDRPAHARQLADIASGIRANVNLIRYNEVKGLPFDRPTTSDVHAFEAILRNRGVNAHLRASRGRDIAAACGQLRRQQLTTAVTNATHRRP